MMPPWSRPLYTAVPATREMPGRSIANAPELPRIATFGRRAARAEAGKVNDEYYKSLKSLGYIR